eukprot:TRINITY_DN13377_c0_g1_i1.p1 TRINITY_DN13377_c0_g1~~TRINITY_DN13377_c0_g1_i1.p1  ORF type:complete len:220 (-),score=3.20 TRINITY_DN13377_c0_g1_i1:14-604(-)
MCRAPSIRQTQRKQMICQCGHRWCITCRGTYHGNSNCLSPRARRLKQAIPILIFILLPMFILYNVLQLLNYLSLTSTLQYPFTSLFQIISTLWWYIVSSVYGLLLYIFPHYITLPLKWCYIIIWQICIVEGISFFCGWIFSICLYVGGLMTDVVWWVVMLVWWIIKTVFYLAVSVIYEVSVRVWGVVEMIVSLIKG